MKRTLLGMILAVGVVVSGVALAQSQLPPQPTVKKTDSTEKEQQKDEKEPAKTPAAKPPVPVAVGKEPDEKTPAKTPDAPPTATDEEAGVMPLAFVKNRLDNMKPGQTGFVAIEAVKVDGKRRVYLDPNQLFGSQIPARPISVRRDGTGFHVTLEAIEHQWTASELPTSVNWLPVKTVTAK
jgi:hypothetical protein